MLDQWGDPLTHAVTASHMVAGEDGLVEIAGAARGKLEALSASVKPNVDSSDLVNLLRLITQADAALSRLGQRAAAVRSEVGQALRAGGQVRQAMRGVHADTGA